MPLPVVALAGMSEAGPDGPTNAADESAGRLADVRSRLAPLVSTWPRRIGVGVVALVAVLALLYLTGVLGAPSAGLEDRGDWGEVTDERTEIVTTLWVRNPNPIGVSLGERLTADCEVVEDLGNRRFRLTTAVRDAEGETVIDGEATVVSDAIPEGED